MTELVLTSTRDGVRVLTLNRPERHNAMSRELYDALLDAVRSSTRDPDVRSVLLRGEGRSFCSGVDTSAIGQRAADETHFSHGRHTQELNLLLQDAPVPIVVALKGHVLGKGLETALAGDIRLVARGARLGFPEVTLGLVTDNGGAPRTTALAGPARAKYLIMSGEPIDAETAVAWGLAEWLVEPEELDDRAFAIAATLARRAPLAVAAAKELVNQVDRAAVLNGTRSEMLAQIALRGTDDHHEGRDAAREKRPPVFRGR